MHLVSSYAWACGLIFCCCWYVIPIESKVVISIDSSSSEEHAPWKSKEPNCTDGMKNGMESDVDCGGRMCEKCENGRNCKTKCDCVSDVCEDHRCIPFATCDDRMQNQNETDMDCGGPNCQKCENGRNCKANYDCTSDVCDDHRCIPFATCSDRMQNQNETDMDCGGPHCPKCENGRNCETYYDCLSYVCEYNRCIPFATCDDRIQNQNETDIDCGGPHCQKCENTQYCYHASDCISDYCNDDHVCSISCVPACQNNGTCINQDICACIDGFTGATCEIQSFGLCYDNDTLVGNPIFSITFGSGPDQYSTKTTADFNFSTTYTQRFEPVTNDGMFSFINSIHDDFNDTWHTGATDHTGNTGGYMFLVNADISPGQFYNSTVRNLCVGLRYELSVYLANICKGPDRIEPNVRFEVRSPAAENPLLAQMSSGNVLVSPVLTWKKYGLSFVAPSSTVILLMISDAPGGLGNDIVLDDIALRACSNQGTGFCPN